MSDRPTILLQHHLKELRLPTFLREYDRMAQQCAAEGVDHPEYLLRLSELELIDRHQGMSRGDCLDWWQARYDRPLERSACVACPFQSRQRWVETKRRWPELFAEAVEIDARIREGLALGKTPYLHSLRMPLDQAVALDEAQLGAGGQRDGFGNECEGHCGL